VANQLNQRFRSGESAGLFMTMVLCVLDTHTGQLQYTCAGHFAPMLLRAGSFITLDDAGGLPLAVMDDADFDDATVALQPGDRFFLYSDGIIEQPAAASAEREEFGAQRLEQMLLEQRDAAVDRVVASAVTTLAKWAGGKAFKDDVSLVAIEWIGGASVASGG
jgi:sigma-B regulation protein RsbU (phosphoserine phosphatase)